MRYPDLCAGLLDQTADLPGMGTSAFRIDIHTIGSGVKDRERCPEFTKYLRRGPECGSVGAIDGDLHSVERHAGNAGPGNRAISRRGIGNRFGDPDIRSICSHGIDLLCENQSLKPFFQRIVQLVAIATKKFQAIIRGRVVRGGDHNASVGAQFFHQTGDGRCGDHAC